MLSPITINNQNIPQPTKLREFKIHIQNDNVAIDGSSQRNRITTPANPRGFKYAINMQWATLTTAEYAVLDNLLGTTGSGVLYKNPSSGKYGVLTFSGLPTVIDESDYVSGESQLSAYEVRIREI
jgi:hypothetical protein